MRYSRDFNRDIIERLPFEVVSTVEVEREEEEVNLEEEAEAWITQFEESVKPGRLFHSRDWVIDSKQIKRERREKESSSNIIFVFREIEKKNEYIGRKSFDSEYLEEVMLHKPKVNRIGMTWMKTQGIDHKSTQEIPWNAYKTLFSDKLSWNSAGVSPPRIIRKIL